jgi:hypothetical protein
MKGKITTTHILNTVTFLVMVAVNAMATLLPINGVTPGQVSDSYPNLFAPTGLTFSIWGLIYLGLACFILYQWGIFGKKVGDGSAVERIGGYFYFSSLVNIAWIYSWHYKIIPLSMVLMAALLVLLTLAYQNITKENLTTKESIFVKLPFSLYFGWITVATIANVTVLLVSLHWSGWGISESAWTIVALAAGLFIGLVTMLRNRDIIYGAVLMWAYAGIMIKHLSPEGFAGDYPEVIIALAISLGLLFIGIIITAIKEIRNSSRSKAQTV